MVITSEKPRIRWTIMVIVWAIVTALAWWHTAVTRDYIGMLDQVRRAGVPTTTPLRQAIPGNFADAQAWVRYAIASQESGRWQMRHTDIDNAPKGREVHWSSLFIQLISAAGRIEHGRTGEPLPRATEKALLWFNLPLLLGCVIGFSAWAARRGGAGAGVLVAAGIIGLSSFYDSFMPTYGDHHGLLTASAFGVALGALLMGVGWRREGPAPTGLLPGSLAAARRAAIGSALCGAFGMWISAASAIPVIALVGITGLAVTLLFGRAARKEGAIFEPGIWRLWGRVGAVASVLFYLLEYAPGHLGWRLEVNHPFHALAWWGGAELIAMFARWHVDPVTGRPAPWQFILPVCAVLAVPVTLVVGGPAAFILRDPFVGDLRHMVVEGISFRAAARDFGTAYTKQYYLYFILAGIGVWLTIAARRDRLVMGFAAFLALAFVGLACWEIRWWLTASAPTLGLIVAGVASLSTTRSSTVRWILVGVTAALIVPAGAISRTLELRRNMRDRVAGQADLLQTLYRDIAGVLRTTQPQGEIVLLASPDASNGIGYYGQFKTIGTLYWENTEGLKAVAAIYGAEQDEQALTLMRARGVTHVAYVSKGDFVTEFFRLSQPNRPSNEIEKTFAHRVFIKQQIPRFLRLIAYRPPPNMGVPDLRVMLFQVVPDQNENQARWHLARAQIELGDAATAERLFRQAIAIAPPNERPLLFQAAADFSAPHGALALAIAFYREALALGENPRAAGELGWILATTTQDALRNGRAALAVVEPALQKHPNDVILLNALAGALAETGRFPEAVEAAGRAMVIIRQSGDTQAAAILQQRIDAYRAGRPWRQ